MAAAKPVILYAEPEDRRRELVAMLGRGDGSRATATGNAAELAQLLERAPRAALLLALGEKPDLALDAVEALPLPRPAFVALGPEEDGRLILRAMRLGAREYLSHASDPTSILAALGRLMADSVVATPARAGTGRVVAVLGSKGGCGATLVASQLALALQTGDERTALADLDLRHGDVALYLDLHPRYDLLEVSLPEARPDATFLEQVLHPHVTGLRVLAAPRKPEDAELVDASRVGEVIELLRADHDWVVLDLSRDFGDTTLAALDRADEILVVTTPDIPSLHHTRRVLGLLERLGHDPARLRLVVNRCQRGNSVGERDVQEFLGRSSDARLPNDWNAALESVNYGRALADAAPRSPLTQAVAGLAVQLRDWSGCERPPAPRRGLLAGLFRRS